MGVGKNNPDVTLHIGGAAVTAPEVKLHRTASYDNAWRFFQSHYDANDYGTLFIRPTLATTPNVEITNSSGAMAMRVDSDTGVISVKNGGGINFSANSNASGMSSEVLDDYEEGTWTPTQGAGITLVGTFSSGGDYIKIGSLVHLTGWVKGSTSIAISAGSSQISGGLPFNIKASGDEMRYDFIVGGGGGVTGGGYAWNTSFYTYSMTTSISATSQKIFFQLTYSVLA